MKKSRPKSVKPKPDPLAAQLAEFTKLVMLGANLYHAGMKQGTPVSGSVEPQFTFAEKPKPGKRDDEKLPDV